MKTIKEHVCKSIEQISTRYRFCTNIIKLASLPGFLSNRGHGDFSVHKLQKRDKQLDMRKLHSQVEFMSTQIEKKKKNKKWRFNTTCTKSKFCANSKQKESYLITDILPEILNISLKLHHSRLQNQKVEKQNYPALNKVFFFILLPNPGIKCGNDLALNVEMTYQTSGNNPFKNCYSCWTDIRARETFLCWQ